MIRINNISFDFTADSEDFANGLYADWDNFCRECFENVVEECLSSHDKNRVMYVMETLDLDLGNIPEEDFYREFPIRLREELLKVLPPLSVSYNEREEMTLYSRLENLLYYLDHGRPKEEWSHLNFCLTEELAWALSVSIFTVRNIVTHCFEKEIAQRRLIGLVDDEQILLRFYAAMFSITTDGLREKRRFQNMLVYQKPRIPVRFIHETTDEAVLQKMAELLDTSSVRQIMETETEEHADVDLPPYWHYLYMWLFVHYPFNGLAIFGSKSGFLRHLDFRLLTFIHKQKYSYYLSKTELTLNFLIEVFGTEYYIDVLNAIYDLQPRNADGSPVHDGYLNMELYNIFLQLSLLHRPVVGVEEKDESPRQDFKTLLRQSENTSNIIKKLLEGCWETDDGFTDWLEDTSISEDNKHELLQKLVAEEPQEWIRLLRKQPRDSKAIALATACLSAPQLLQGMARADFYQESVLSRTVEWLQHKADGFAFLTGNNILFSTALSKALLLYMQDEETVGGRTLTEKETICKFLSYLHLVYTGKTDYRDDAEWADFLIEVFGTEYYIEVLSAINDLQPHNEDGSPVYRGYLNMELYNIFLQLSLLHRPVVGVEEKDESPRQDFKTLLRQSENTSNIIKKLLEGCWETDDGFTDWLEDTSISEDNKHELLQKLVAEEPQEWIRLLRKQPRESKAIALATACLSAPQLLQGMARADFYQESVLSRTVEWLQRKADGFAFLTGNNIHLSTALSKALLLYMQDEETVGGRTLTEKETICKFLSYLHLVYTGKTDYRDDAEWADLSGRMATELETDDWQETDEKAVAGVLLNKGRGVDNATFERYLVSIMKKKPEQLLAWLEKDADNSLIERIAETSDVTVLDQWTESLRSIPGFEHFDAFRQLMEWLSRIATNRTSVSDTVSVLLYWLKETDWRKQTPEQMEDYFISRLFIGDAVRLPFESIAVSTLPESIRRRVLQGYTYFQPKELLDYIRQSVKRNVLPLDKWLEWLDISDWMRMVANISLSRAELLQQIMARLAENNQVKETDLLTALATCLINNRAEEWIYSSKEETLRSFIQSIPSLHENTKIKTEIMEENMKKELNLTGAEEQPATANQVESPEYILVGNAGLCLFSPWFYRLMKLLGYLNEENRDFKDTESRIRAVFLLQYLTSSVEKTSLETELAFNRLLVALPTHIPLPESLLLTDKEKEFAENLMLSVKGYWDKLRGMSLSVLQSGFITRTGRLEQQEERWLLTVDMMPFDILLDDVTWEFRQIRLPWLKKYVQVVWREKKE